MKTILIIVITIISLTSCSRWRIPDMENKYLIVLKRDGNLVKTKVRVSNDFRVEAATQDTMTSRVESGKATITTTTLKGVTIPAKTKGNIVEEDGNFYFVFKEKEYQKVGRIPLNVNKGNISIKVEKILRIDDKSHQKYKLKMVGTRLIVDTNDPGFELRIKEDEKTESIKETN
jgi:hypothetical protein